jgi:hypothetical protein
MRHGWIFIYESSPALARFKELVAHFASKGVSLVDPGSGLILRISEFGEQTPSSKDALAKELVDSGKVVFNFYLAPSDNIFCSIETLKDEIIRESYSLDGKTEEQSFQIIEILTELFIERVKKQVASLLVADRFAELNKDFHWDDFAIGDEPRPPEWPLLLGFSNSCKMRFMVPDELYTHEEGTNYVLRRRIGQFQRLKEEV